VLEYVVENDVIQRQNVLHLDVSEPVLGRGEVAERVRDEDAAVIAFDAIQQPVNTLTDCLLDRRLIYSVVGRPSSHLITTQHSAVHFLRLIYVVSDVLLEG